MGFISHKTTLVAIVAIIFILNIYFYLSDRYKNSLAKKLSALKYIILRNNQRYIYIDLGLFTKGIDGNIFKFKQLRNISVKKYDATENSKSYKCHQMNDYLQTLVSLPKKITTESTSKAKVNLLDITALLNSKSDLSGYETFKDLAYGCKTYPNRSIKEYEISMSVIMDSISRTHGLRLIHIINTGKLGWDNVDSSHTFSLAYEQAQHQGLKMPTFNADIISYEVNMMVLDRISHEFNTYCFIRNCSLDDYDHFDDQYTIMDYIIYNIKNIPKLFFELESVGINEGRGTLGVLCVPKRFSLSEEVSSTLRRHNIMYFEAILKLNLQARKSKYASIY